MTKKQVVITLVTFKPKQIKYLQPYYKKGNRWYKLKVGK